MSRLFLIAVISLILPACTPPPPAPPATDVNAVRDAVGKIRTDWIAAAERDDAAAVAQFYTDDAVMMGADGVVARGRRGIQDYFAKAFATSGGVQVTPAAFDASGDLAYDSGRYSQDVTPPGGQPMKVSGHYVVVLKRQADGAWKIVQHIATPEAPPQTT
jgi:uncharacterized protein (TIGR02246 family)